MEDGGCSKFKVQGSPLSLVFRPVLCYKENNPHPTSGLLQRFIRELGSFNMMQLRTSIPVPPILVEPAGRTHFADQVMS